MKDLFFFPSEYDLLAPVLMRLTPDEILGIYDLKYTICAREPFDLDFLNLLKWRSNVFEHIGERLQSIPE
jgi:hypothetical protein